METLQKEVDPGIIENLTIDGTDKNPEVLYKKGVLYVSGRCIPEHSADVREPIHSGLQELAEKWQISKIVFYLEYFNTASAKHIEDILRKDTIGMGEGSLNIDRYYDEDDEDLLESWEDYQTLTQDLNNVPHMGTRNNIEITKKELIDYKKK